MVFNRWGDLVHERTELPITSPDLPWDGFVKGEAAGSGVYAYFIEVAWPDGRLERLQGDVSLVR